ncbi:hypothetical protein EVAR_18205_1 [Eumeta japonica]|uniref:Uncharacterized protein n=1 Tax=Eumeta variegata TaxID=151549 RepID=A0A4C1UWL3_EUMVA|nr:hypothetical protein EVAR_18205_1 [Eumeta japonica]
MDIVSMFRRTYCSTDFTSGGRSATASNALFLCGRVGKEEKNPLWVVHAPGHTDRRVDLSRHSVVFYRNDVEEVTRMERPQLKGIRMGYTIPEKVDQFFGNCAITCSRDSSSSPSVCSGKRSSSAVSSDESSAQSHDTVKGFDDEAESNFVTVCKNRKRSRKVASRQFNERIDKTNSMQMESESIPVVSMIVAKSSNLPNPSKARSALTSTEKETAGARSNTSNGAGRRTYVASCPGVFSSGYDPDGSVVMASFRGSKLEEFPSQQEIKRSCQWVTDIILDRYCRLWE